MLIPKAPTFFSCRAMRPDFSVTSDKRAGLSIATWTEPVTRVVVCKWVRGVAWEHRMELCEECYWFIVESEREAA